MLFHEATIEQQPGWRSSAAVTIITTTFPNKTNTAPIVMTGASIPSKPQTPTSCCADPVHLKSIRQ